MNTLRERQDIDTNDTWDLSGLFKSREDFFAALEELKPVIEKVGSFDGKIHSANGLFDALEALYAAKYKVEHIAAYAHFRQDQDARVSQAQADYQRAEQVALELGQKSAFFAPQIQALNENDVRAWLAEERFAQYRFVVEEILRLKAHTLSPNEEKIMALAGDLVLAPENIYSMLTTVDVKFPKIKDENDDEIEVSSGRFIPLMESRNRRVRSDAFTAKYESYGAQIHIFSASLLAMVQANNWNARARGYSSAMEASMSSSGVDPKVYTALVDRLTAHMPMMHDYVGLRGEVLGLKDDVHMYDVYVPMAKIPEREYPFAEAKDIVLDSVAPLGADYQNKMKRAFDERWIDVYENRGKRSGAYMHDVYGLHPFVLLNHQGNLDSVFTLAHELGHAMQSVLSDAAQPFPLAQYDLFIAEVASTFNEQLLLEYLLKNETDKSMRLYLLNHGMEAMRTTAYRQTMFEEFECFIHDQNWRGEPITADDMDAKYLALNQKYYGPKMIVDPLIAHEWARIPHFYYNFYVYQYATGLCSAISLCKDVLSSGDASRYLRFLSEGGSRNPMEILISAGVGLLDGSYVDAAAKDFVGKMAGYKALL